MEEKLTEGGGVLYSYLSIFHSDSSLVRRIVVDVERGRTVREWKPRRLGKRLKALGSDGLKHRKAGASVVQG